MIDEDLVPLGVDPTKLTASTTVSVGDDDTDFGNDPDEPIEDDEMGEDEDLPPESDETPSDVA